MDKVTRQCPQTTTFLKRRESRSGIEPWSFRLPALPLGQTGSQVLVEHGVVLYCDAKVLRGSDVLPHLVVQFILVTTGSLFAAHGQDTALAGVETHVLPLFPLFCPLEVSLQSVMVL